MSRTSLKRSAAPDNVAIVGGYHRAINALDYDAIESFFTETAVYISDGVGPIEGRDAIVESFRAYFAEYPDQTARDLSIEAISERAVRTEWTLTATSSRTGRKLVRAGEETVFLDQHGFIEKVIVRDR